MPCNPRKCKELTLRKKGFVEELYEIHDNISQCSDKHNYKCASHVRENLLRLMDDCT